MEETILTRHPEGRKGVNISKDKYDTVRSAIVGSLRKGQLSRTELIALVEDALTDAFEGSIAWYTECVRLDLEARHMIKRTATRPQRYRLLRV